MKESLAHARHSFGNVPAPEHRFQIPSAAIVEVMCRCGQERQLCIKPNVIPPERWVGIGPVATNEGRGASELMPSLTSRPRVPRRIGFVADFRGMTNSSPIRPFRQQEFTLFLGESGTIEFVSFRRHVASIRKSVFQL